MDDICLYQIQIRGQVEADEINAMSPVHVTLDKVTKHGTVLTVRTDQSGLVGLIRCLHGMGYVLLSVQNEAADMDKTL